MLFRLIQCSYFLQKEFMPELPEVESFKNFIDKTSLNKTIESIKLAAPNMLLQTTSRKLSTVLKGNSFVRTLRH